MTRLALKSALPLAFVFGVACAVPAVTAAQAQGSRDPANQRNLNDPAVDFQAQGRPLNDPANARNINDPADRRDPADSHSLNDKGGKRDVK